jgi:hypothetical protein
VISTTLFGFFISYLSDKPAGPNIAEESRCKDYGEDNVLYNEQRYLTTAGGFVPFITFVGRDPHHTENYDADKAKPHQQQDGAQNPGDRLASVVTLSSQYRPDERRPKKPAGRTEIVQEII